jgi:hypothetical protein
MMLWASRFVGFAHSRRAIRYITRTVATRLLRVVSLLSLSLRRKQTLDKISILTDLKWLGK